MNTNFADETIPPHKYLLPTALAFMPGRWPAFWDILYYLAQQPPITIFSDNFLGLDLETSRFSRLLGGVGQNEALAPAVNESGRKLLRQFLREAIEKELVIEIPEKDDPYLNNYGANAIRRLRLTLYPKILLPLEGPSFIVKPVDYVVNGWVALGNTYEQHLLNLLLLFPNITCDPNYLWQLLAQVRGMDANSVKKEPGAIRRGIVKAWNKLESYELVSGKKGLSDKAFSRNFRTIVTLTADPRLANYERRDPLRATRLLRLLHEGLIREDETKLAWNTLADFPSAADFDLLHTIFVKRNEKGFSFKQVVNTARSTRSHRGSRPGATGVSRNNFPHRFSKLQFGEGEEIRLISRAFKPALNLGEIRLRRVRLEIWVRVPEYNRFALIPAKELPPNEIIQVRVRLPEGDIIYQSNLYTISPNTQENHWTIPIEREINKLLKSGSAQPTIPDLLNLEIVRNSDSNLIPKWFSLSVRLTFFT